MNRENYEKFAQIFLNLAREWHDVRVLSGQENRGNVCVKNEALCMFHFYDPILKLGFAVSPNIPKNADWQFEVVCDRWQSLADKSLLLTNEQLAATTMQHLLRLVDQPVQKKAREEFQLDVSLEKLTARPDEITAEEEQLLLKLKYAFRSSSGELRPTEQGFSALFGKMRIPAHSFYDMHTVS